MRRHKAPATGLTVDDLRGMREARAAVNHETYKMLLRQVHDRVRARAANRLTHMSFQVPPLVPGRPLFTTSHAARYIADKLRIGGFDVHVSSPHSDVHIVHATWETKTPKNKKQARKKERRTDREERRPLASSNSAPTLTSLPATMAEVNHRLNRLKAQLNI